MSLLDRLKVYSRHLTLGHAVLIGDRLCEPAVVISGASEGIGRAFAELLTEKGFTLLLIARDVDAIEDLAEELRNGNPQARLETLGVDVTSPDATTRVAAELRDRNLYADVLINNAGIGLGGRFASHTMADVQQLIDTNIGALVRLTHQFLPEMCARSTGGILNVASLAGFMPGPWQAMYFASKAFVLSFSQAVGQECADSGVRIMVAAPGPVETRIHSAMKTRWSWYRRLFPSYLPSEVAEILWHGFVTGERLLVPGLVNNISALGSRFLPPDLLTGFVGWLVRPRFRSGRPVD
jgi:uncharacterized protein